MKVGFIGLGIMGKPMCRNLMKAGYEAVVYNRSKASVEELAAEGAQAAGSEEFYKFIDHNPMFQMQPVDYVNDPYVIGQNYMSKGFSMSGAGKG